MRSGWPQDCKSGDRGWVPGPVADRMLDIMPSKRLVFHEYRKHGTCTGLGVDAYFDLARKLHDKVKIPPRFVNLTDERMFVGVTELVQDFLAANPELKPDMLSVQCGGAGNRLKEVRVCFTKDGQFRACGRNEDQRRLCSADRMYVPPVRLGPAREGVGGARKETGPSRGPHRPSGCGSDQNRYFSVATKRESANPCRAGQIVAPSSPNPCPISAGRSTTSRGSRASRRHSSRRSPARSWGCCRR